MQRALIVMALAVLLPQAAAARGTWSGKVVDQLSGQGIVGARVCGGGPGRVDIVCGKTGAVGVFSISYPATYHEKIHALYVKPPEPARYYNQVRLRPAPGPVIAKLVPKFFTLKAQVVSAETGQPVAGAEVSLGEPGVIQKSLVTDGTGMVTFGLVRDWEDPGAQYNTHGVEPAEILAPWKADKPLVKRALGLRVTAKGYATVHPVYEKGKAIVPIPRTASASEAVYTLVKIRLPRAGVAKLPPLSELLSATVHGAP